MTTSDGIKGNSAIRLSFICVITLVYAMPILAFYVRLSRHRGSFPVEYYWTYLTALVAAISMWIYIRLRGLRSELSFGRLLLCSFIPLLAYLLYPEY